jgi:putative component of membrane protein insertase Oxa1/YidC/SpoIIIJ protein YidD
MIPHELLLSPANSLDRILARLTVGMIRIYQRHLSPIKGYSCAHRLHHGGLSCSEFGRRAFEAEGMAGGWRSLRGRFKECRAAAIALRSGRLLMASDDGTVPQTEASWGRRIATGLLDCGGEIGLTCCAEAACSAACG